MTITVFSDAMIALVLSITPQMSLISHRRAKVPQLRTRLNRRSFGARFVAHQASTRPLIACDSVTDAVMNFASSRAYAVEQTTAPD